MHGNPLRYRETYSGFHGKTLKFNLFSRNDVLVPISFQGRMHVKTGHYHNLTEILLIPILFIDKMDECKREFLKSAYASLITSISDRRKPYFIQIQTACIQNVTQSLIQLLQTTIIMTIHSYGSDRVFNYRRMINNMKLMNRECCCRTEAINRHVESVHCREWHLTISMVFSKNYFTGH